MLESSCGKELGIVESGGECCCGKESRWMKWGDSMEDAGEG